jgi:hypothetical protein
MMSFVIKRTSEKDGQTKILSGAYGDRETALEVLEEVLTTYHIHGQRGSDEYWWARDDEYRRFTFVITSI